MVILEKVGDAVKYFRDSASHDRKTISVLHLPTNVGGNGSMLARLERENGLNSTCLYEWEICNGKTTGADCVLKFRMGRLYNLRIVLFYILTARYIDVYHFNWGSTLIRSEDKWYDQFDLKLLKLLRKRMVVTFQGTDCRQADVAMEKYQYTWYRDMNVEQLNRDLQMDPMRRRRIRQFDKYADTLYCNTADLKDMLPERTVFRIHSKLKLSEWLPVYSDYTKETIKIFHAPTNRLVKGTSYIVDAIDRLRTEGCPVELVLIENMPNDEARKVFESCDLAIDQLFGWFGGFTLEAWALGKPVVVGVREDHLKHLPPQMAKELPCVNVTPDNLYDVLKELINDRPRLERIAHESRAFVEKWYDCDKAVCNIIENYKHLLGRKD